MPNDVDYFRFSVSNSTIVSIYTTGDIDVEGVLQNDSGVELETDDDSGAGSNFRIEHPVPAGDYYVRVTASGAGKYGIFIAPEDHDDTPENGTILVSGDDVAGILSSREDVDYFRFHVPLDSRLTVYTTGTTGTITTGELMKKGAIGSVASDSGLNESRHFRIEQVVAPGDYYVRVSGFLATSYRIFLTLEPFDSSVEPDLAVDSVFLPGVSLNAGSVVIIIAIARNVGTRLSPRAPLNIFLSDDPMIETSDLRICPELNFVPLSLGQAEGVGTQCLIPFGLKQARNWIGACIHSVQGESNTANNCSPGSEITVTSPPLSYPTTARVTTFGRQVIESDPGLIAGFVVTLNKPVPRGFAVGVVFTLGGSAVLNDDYTLSLAGAFSNPPFLLDVRFPLLNPDKQMPLHIMRQSATVTVTAIDDGLPEGTETVTFELQGLGDLNVVGANPVNITIDDDEVAALPTTARVTLIEGRTSEAVPAATAGLTVDLNKAVPVNSTVRIAFTRGGSAELDDDYTLSATGAVLDLTDDTLTFHEHGRHATLTVTAVADTLLEGAETMTFEFRGVGDLGVIGMNPVNIRIDDDEAAALPTTARVTLIEGRTSEAVPAATAGLTVDLNKAVPVNSTVRVAFTRGGSAELDDDYALSATGAALDLTDNTLTFHEHGRHATLTVTAVADTLLEGAETVTFEFRGVGGLGVIGMNPVNIRIDDDEVAALPTTARVTLIEGRTSEAVPAATAGLTVDLNKAVPVNSTVRVAFTRGGSAVLDDDYTLSATDAVLDLTDDTLTFHEHGRHATLTVTAVADTLLEGAETVTFEFRGVGGLGVIGMNPVNIRIDDDEAAALPTTARVTLIEGRTSEAVPAAPAGLAVDLNKAVPANSTVRVAFTRGGSAVLGDDYLLSATGAVLDLTDDTLTFHEHGRNATLTVTAVADTLLEGAETVTFEFRGVGGLGVIGTNPVSFTIDDDEAAALPTTARVTLIEGRTSEAVPAATAGLAVDLNKAVPANSTVRVAFTRGGSAVLGDDYLLSATGAVLDLTDDTLTFHEHGRHATLTVTAVADTLLEGAETVTFEFRGVGGLGVIGMNPVSLTIDDDEAAALPTTARVTLIEGRTSEAVPAATAGLTVDLNKAVPANSTVRVAFTRGGSAVLDDDYTLSATDAVLDLTDDTLTFHEHGRHATLTVTAVADTLLEGAETVTFEFRGVGGLGVIGTNPVRITIEDDEDPILKNFRPDGASIIPETNGVGAFILELADDFPVNSTVLVVYELPKIERRLRTAIPGVDYVDIRSFGSIETDEIHGVGEIIIHGAERSTRIGIVSIPDGIMERNEPIVVRIVRFERIEGILPVSPGYTTSTAVIYIQDDGSVHFRIRVFLEGALQ